MIRPKNILLRLLLVAIPVLMALAPAKAQTNSVYAGQTSPLSVVEIPGDTYEWELYKDVSGINFATMPGNCPAGDAYFVNGINTGATVNVTWLSPGTYFFKVTSYRGGCTMNLKVGKMIVLEPLPTAIISPPPSVCTGESGVLSIALTGTGPWSIDISDGTNTTTYTSTTNIFTTTISPTQTTNYTVVRVSDANGTNINPSNSVTVTVNPKPKSSKIYKYNPK